MALSKIKDSVVKQNAGEQRQSRHHLGLHMDILICVNLPHYVIIKAYENALLGKTIEDYADIIEARQYARSEINRINK